MARGTVLTEGIKRLIAPISLEHPDWGAQQIRKEVINQSHRVMPYVDPDWPGLSAVQKQLAKIRRRDAETIGDPLDAPWSLGSLGIKQEYELPPEVIPIVLDAKRSRKPQPPAERAERIAHIMHILEDETKRNPAQIRQLLKIEDKPEPPFSVREAKWVARITFALKDRLTSEGIGWWAHLYAEFERSCELAGVPCDTSSLDIGLLNRDLLAYLTWTLSKDMLNRKQEAQDIERKMFGHTLEDIELTPLGWVLYQLWLGLVKDRAKKLPKLSIKEREDFVKRLRAWVIEKEPVEELMYPEELLTEVEYSMLFGETPIR